MQPRPGPAPTLCLGPGLPWSGQGRLPLLAGILPLCAMRSRHACPCMPCMAHAWPMQHGREGPAACTVRCMPAVGGLQMPGAGTSSWSKGGRLPVLLPQEVPQISDTATYPPPPKQDVATAAPRSVPVAELVGKEDGEKRRRRKSEGEKGGIPQNGGCPGRGKRHSK